MTNKVLFICRRADYHFGHRCKTKTTGLRTSAGMCSRTLEAAGVPSKLVIVNDSNDIDREVTSYRPSHVILEALWVPPDKFADLIPLHPEVRWMVRLHSEVPFLAHEGIATDWIRRYSQLYPRVVLSGNSPRLVNDLDMIGRGKPVVYLPNCYIFDPFVPHQPYSPYLQVACFGAVRPLKNTLLQAVAALKYAERDGRLLRFHVNCDRIEGGGDGMMKNLRNLFTGRGDRLVEHPWLEHSELLQLLSGMDIGLQLSLTETFNHVAADFVRAGLPMVTSPSLPWPGTMFQADPLDSDDIVRAMRKALNWGSWGVAISRRRLRNYAKESERLWLKYFT